MPRKTNRRKDIQKEKRQAAYAALPRAERRKIEHEKKMATRWQGPQNIGPDPMLAVASLLAFSGLPRKRASDET